MDIKILELEADKARISFVGENHTFMNMLADEILKDPKVDVARYAGKFHFTDPELIVTTVEGRDPIEAITDASAHLAGYCDNLLEQIKKA